MDLVSRYDVAALGTPERTSQGFLRIPAYLTRVGVLEYRRADGQVVRELRPRDEVFRAQSLATLSAAPVTDLHPTQMVGPHNVRELQIGHVSDHVQADGNLVSAYVTIQEAKAIAAVEAGERRELSCGYACRVDATPGEHDGKPYDQVQRDIVYNHVAIGPRNWGRAGRDIALRVDAADGDAGGDEVFRLDAADALGTSTLDAPECADELDEDETDDDGAAKPENPTYQELLDRIQELEGRTDGVLLEQDPVRFVRDENERTELTAERDALQARCDGLTADLAAAHRSLEQARNTQQREFDAAVATRADLVDRARRVLGGEHRYEGQSARQVQEAVLTHRYPTLDLKQCTDHDVCTRFDQAMLDVSTSDGASNLDEARRITSPGPRFVSRAERADARETFVPDWQKPLSFSKSRRKEL